MLTTTIALRLWMELASMNVSPAAVVAMRDVQGTTVPACAVLLQGQENDVLFADSCAVIKVKLGLK